jgi:hypothetical protein
MQTLAYTDTPTKKAKEKLQQVYRGVPRLVDAYAVSFGFSILHLVMQHMDHSETKGLSQCHYLGILTDEEKM